MVGLLPRPAKGAYPNDLHKGTVLQHLVPGRVFKGSGVVKRYCKRDSISNSFVQCCLEIRIEPGSQVHALPPSTQAGPRVRHQSRNPLSIWCGPSRSSSAPGCGNTLRPESMPPGMTILDRPPRRRSVNRSVKGGDDVVIVCLLLKTLIQEPD